MNKLFIAFLLGVFMLILLLSAALAEASSANLKRRRSSKSNGRNVRLEKVSGRKLLEV